METADPSALSPWRLERLVPEAAEAFLGVLLLPSPLQYCPLLASLQIRVLEINGLEFNPNQEALIQTRAT